MIAWYSRDRSSLSSSISLWRVTVGSATGASGSGVRGGTPMVAPLRGAAMQGECFVLTVKQRCLDHFVFFGGKHLRFVLREFERHDNEERPHQGVGNKPLGEWE